MMGLDQSDLSDKASLSHLLPTAAWAAAALLLIYLVQINRLLSGTPEEVQRLSPTRWTKELLRQTYKKLEMQPVATDTYAHELPPALERRYIVTGGSGGLTTLPCMYWTV